MYNDKFDKIFGEDSAIGFLFPCSKSHLNQPIYLSKKEVREIPESFGNPDLIFIRCKQCNQMMTYHHGSEDLLDGKWKCESCGRTVREETPYQILEKINREFEDKMFARFKAEAKNW